MLVVSILSVSLPVQASTDFARVRIGVTHRSEFEAMVGKPLSEPFPGTVYTYAVSHYLVKRAEVTFNAAGRIESLTLLVRPGVSKKVAVEMFRLGSTSHVMHNIEGNFVEVYPSQGALVTYSGSGDNDDVVKVTFVDSVLLEIVRPVVRVTYSDAYVFGFGVDVEQAKDGIRVTKVYPRTAAQEADIETGDTITEFDGQLMNHADDAEKFKLVIKTFPVGEPIEAYVKRGQDLQWKQLTLRALTPEEEYSQFCLEIGGNSAYTANLFFPTRDRCVLQFTPGAPYRPDAFPFEVGQRVLFDRYATFKQSEDLSAREEFLKALLPASLFSSDLKGVFPEPIGSVNEDAWDIVKGYAVFAASLHDYALASEALLRVVDARPGDLPAAFMLAYACEQTSSDQMAVTYYRQAQSLTSDAAFKDFIEKRLRALHVTIE